MAALIDAAPQAGRILRPLCRMLGVRPRRAEPAQAASRPAGGAVPPRRVRPGTAAPVTRRAAAASARPGQRAGASPRPARLRPARPGLSARCAGTS